MSKLKIGKDYINKDGLIVIDRTGDTTNRGLDRNNFEYDLFCSSPYVWREAAKSEVIEAFKKHLIHRYGKDWERMKIKKRHPHQFDGLNDGFWKVAIVKDSDGWSVWNKNGLIYRDGIWVERLEEPIKSSDWVLAPEEIEEVTTKNLDIALRSKSLTPHRCPVCNGNGLVPNGFYMQTSGHWSTTSITPETCRSCDGTGIVWG